MERRRELLVAARDAFLDRGFVATTVDDIVAAAGVARGTFYLYFSDKRAVFEALVDDFHAQIGDRVQSIVLEPGAPTAIVQLRANVRRVVEFALEEPALVKVTLFDASGVDPAIDRRLRRFYEGLQALIGESLEVGQALGWVRPGDRRMMVSIGLGGFKEVLGDAVAGRVSTDPEAVTEEIMRFLVGGLLSEELRGKQ